MRCICPLATVLCCAIAATAAGAASAQAPTGSAPLQYVEVLPGAGGATTAPPASGSASAAQQYVEVVPYAGGGNGAGGLSTAGQNASDASPVGAAVSAIASGDERHIVGLGAAMVIVTLWLLGATARRYRRRASLRSVDGGG